MPFLSTLSPDSQAMHSFMFCPRGFTSSGHFMSMDSDAMWSLVTGFVFPVLIRVVVCVGVLFLLEM